MKRPEARPKVPGLERELRFGPGEMWWTPVVNEHPEVRAGDNFPPFVTICDETLREGEETPGVILSLDDRLVIARKLEEVGVPEAEAGYVGAIPEHFEFSRELKRSGTRLKLVSHTRTYTRADEWKAEIDRAVEAGSDVLCLLASMSETLCATTPWLPKAAVPDRIAASVEYTRSLGIIPAVTLVDGVRTPLDDFLLANRVAAEAGARRVYVMDGQGVALPETASFLVRKLREVLGANVEIAVHFHDDFGLATANTLSAIRAGASVVDVVVNGLGDKAGIGALEEVVAALEILYGVKTGIDLSRLVALSELVQERFRLPVAANKSIVGPNTTRHQIDAHLATILRGYWWAWETIRPEFFGRQRSLEWARGKLRVGRSGALQAKLESMGIELSDKEFEQLAGRIRAAVDRLDVLSEDPLEALIAERSPPGTILRG